MNLLTGPLVLPVRWLVCCALHHDPALRASRLWDPRDKQLLVQGELGRRRRQEAFLVEGGAQVKASQAMRGGVLNLRARGEAVWKGVEWGI